MSTSPSSAPAAPVPPTITYKHGLSEAIAWKELTYRERYKGVDLLLAGDTPGIISLVAHRNDEWVESVDEKTFHALAVYCVNLVFTMAERLAESDRIVGLKLVPIRNQMFRQAESLYSMISDASRMGIDLNGAAASPTVPPAAAATATPSASPISPTPSSPTGSAPAAPSSPSGTSPS